MKLLELLARVCAVAAGLLLTAIAVLTCISLVGRNAAGMTLAGDFELTGVASGAAIALFLPWCQARRGNIIVDFFTTRASARTQGSLDRLGALLLGACLALLTWRTTIGGLAAWDTQSGTMMLGFPEWIVYALIVPGLALTALIAFWQAAFGFAPEQEQAP
jgi:TRAP-type C4-dicarboxylate transport system permease small subunit